MKLDINNALGKASEHFFAYWMMKNFNWPCRLLDVDIGIDAQLEIMGDNSHSLGEFIAVQVKSNSSPKLKVEIKTKHIEYWRMIDDPVVLVLVSHVNDNPELYWKVLDEKFLNTPLGQKKTTTVTFSEKEKLLPSSKQEILMLPYKSGLITIKEISTEFEELYNSVCIPCYSNEHDEFSHKHCSYYDLETAKGFLEDFDRACVLKDELDKVLEQFPSIPNFNDDFPVIYDQFYELEGIITNMASDLKELDHEHEFEVKKSFTSSNRHKTVVKMFE
ncbi:DUF4365 domain-containing protein [Flavobacterium beibuense]|uniref:DUF4365 domain-containing protein n=1 Tax=Flavobacterium beibuense TaxID=657326 RepID=UPI003A93F2D1